MKPENELILSFYQDITTIGKFSNITLVQHIDTGRIFVKKILSCYDISLYKRLSQKHIPGIPKIYHVIDDGEKLIVIEEYINGITLSDYETENGVFTVNDTLNIAIQLCDIIHRLHSLSPPVIHRDIKPSNIIVSQDLKITLIDFDASKIFDAEKTRDTILMGTADFAAPEQFGFSQSDARTDIYAVGTIINVMLTGKLPKDELCDKPISKIVLTCTSIDPDKRYRSAMHLSSVLKKYSRCSAPRSAVPPGFRTRKPWKMLLAAPIYLLITFCAVTLEVSGRPSAVEIYANRISFFISYLMVIAICTNYLGISDKLPLCRSSNFLLKILGSILWISIFLIGIITLMNTIIAIA